MDPEAGDLTGGGETHSSHNGDVLADLHATMAEMERGGRGEIEDARESERGADWERELSEIERERAASSAGDEGEGGAELGDEGSEESSSGSDPYRAQHERWSPVMDYLGIKPENALNEYMEAVVALRQDPVGALTALAKQYAGDRGQDLIAALAGGLNVDPYDIDVDRYQQDEPGRRQSAELQQLRQEVVSLRMGALKASGNFPLLGDPAAAQRIAAVMRRGDISVEEAYAAAVFSDPGLSSKHQKAVAGSSAEPDPAARRNADAARRSRVRRARAADLPRGAGGERTPAKTGNRVYDDAREVALEIGFLGS